MMDSLQNQAKELVKGCREDYFDSRTGSFYEQCGDDEEYCPICNTKIQTLVQAWQDEITFLDKKYWRSDEIKMRVKKLKRAMELLRGVMA